MQKANLCAYFNSSRRNIARSRFHMQSQLKTIGFIITVLFTLICLKLKQSRLDLSAVSGLSNAKAW